MGISAIGSSVGGTVFPVAAQNLIPEVGYVSIRFLLGHDFDYRLARFKWTMRIFGSILVVLLGVANLVSSRDSFPRATMHWWLKTK